MIPPFYRPPTPSTKVSPLEISDKLQTWPSSPLVVAGDICPKTPLSPRAARQPEANLPSRALDGRRWAEGEGELKNQFLGPKLPTLITRSPSPALAPVGGQAG